MSAPTLAAADGYILDRTERECHRLRAQSRIWEPMTRRMLAEAGLRPGMRCLDVGCGPGEAMRLMGEAVGTEGEVTGLDIDRELGAYAIAELNAGNATSYRFFACDITGDAPVPGAPFDMVFARFLLIHMTDPLAVVRRLASLVRPGGRLVLMDYDLTRTAIRPEDPVIQRGIEILNACFERSGKYADAGLRLPELMLAAGLPHPEGFGAEPFFGPFPVVGQMLCDVLGSLADTARALGVASRAEIDAVIGYCGALAAARRHFALGPTLHCAWTTIEQS